MLQMKGASSQKYTRPENEIVLNCNIVSTGELADVGSCDCLVQQSCIK
jgi:hypothetical protein